MDIQGDDPREITTNSHYKSIYCYSKKSKIISLYTEMGLMYG